ncbi:AT-rich interactive domain-containing protein 4 [Zea mays]|uniref:AT-rich interactive domain-containing protein 4 n=1 Tax=Zea mays TaxID=4577 RepID=A0A1D6EQW3_MAIZE|nr:AT-rich interactive domain-containing protein 4 [Zea mays]
MLRSEHQQRSLGWRRSGHGRLTHSRSSAQLGDWRSTHCLILHQSSSSRRSGWCSPTSCTSRVSSLRMRRRLAHLCGGTPMSLIRRRLALLSAHHSQR